MYARCFEASQPCSRCLTDSMSNWYPRYRSSCSLPWVWITLGPTVALLHVLLAVYCIANLLYAGLTDPGIIPRAQIDGEPLCEIEVVRESREEQQQHTQPQQQQQQQQSPQQQAQQAQQQLMQDMKLDLVQQQSSNLKNGSGTIDGLSSVGNPSTTAASSGIESPSVLLNGTSSSTTTKAQQQTIRSRSVVLKVDDEDEQVHHYTGCDVPDPSLEEQQNRLSFDDDGDDDIDEVVEADSESDEQHGHSHHHNHSRHDRHRSRRKKRTQDSERATLITSMLSLYQLVVMIERPAQQPLNNRLPPSCL